MEEGEFGSFIVIEDNKKKAKEKDKIFNLKSSAPKKEIKITNNKNDILIYDEKSKRNKIISDDYSKEEIDNSFLKKNDFCIYSKTNTKQEKIKKNNTANITNTNKANINLDIIDNYITSNSRLFKIEEEKSIVRRSDSFNYNSRTSTVLFVNKIQKNNKNKDISGFINLIETKENPDPLKADCVLYDKKNNAFNGIINVDQKFKCSFKLEEKENNNLYYNEEYYIFSLLEIKNYNINPNYFGKDTVEINLKDSRYYLFKLKNKYREFVDILDTFAEPEQSSSFYKNALTRCKNLKQKFEINGWEIYDFNKEFERQKVDFKYTNYIIDNSNFQFCPTYPKKIIVPNMSKQDLEKCAYFRTKKRIPTLTYKHKNGFCIWRSSQTKSGFMGKSEKDVTFLTKISESSKKLIVYDARPKLNAMANKLKGAGYENTNNYPNINMEVIFCGIPNIHAVRSSYEKMLTNISYNNDNEYGVISNLPSASWYETIILILKSGFQIYNSINNKCTVLIHCSDGWDRTAQLACTSQLLLDKYYRTLQGFICLIEKDWLSFGHQFRYRNGFYSKVDPEANSENQFSPIFLQWLDCVYQLMYQNYSKFEFNFNLLTFLASEVFAGKFGTFLFNNEKEREKNNARTKTISIWSVVMKEKKYYLNPIYDPDNNKAMNINYKKIKLWSEYFYRFEKGDNEYNYLKKLNSKINSYEKNIKKKDQIIEELSKFIMNNKLDLAPLSEDCRNEMSKFFQQNSDIQMSFEILKPTNSILNMKSN